jgi:hypothetical protein
VAANFVAATSGVFSSGEFIVSLAIRVNVSTGFVGTFNYTLEPISTSNTNLIRCEFPSIIPCSDALDLFYNGHDSNVTNVVSFLNDTYTMEIWFANFSWTNGSSKHRVVLPEREATTFNVMGRIKPSCATACTNAGTLGPRTKTNYTCYCACRNTTCPSLPTQRDCSCGACRDSASSVCPPGVGYLANSCACDCATTNPSCTDTFF